jgi:hypothetical protein
MARAAPEITLQDNSNVRWRFCFRPSLSESVFFVEGQVFRTWLREGAGRKEAK